MSDDNTQPHKPVSPDHPADQTASPPPAVAEELPVADQGPAYVEPGVGLDPVSGSAQPEYDLVEPIEAAPATQVLPESPVLPESQTLPETGAQPAVPPVAGAPADSVAAHAPAADSVAAEPATPASSTNAWDAEPIEAETVVVAGEPFPAQTVYVEPADPPLRRGNRGFGVLFAIIGTIVYAGALAGATALLQVFRGLRIDFQFVADFSFYVPVIVFVVLFILLVLLVNRASLWAYVLGSLFVGALVYLGTVVWLVLFLGGSSQPQSELFARAFVDPFAIAAGVVAREAVMWFGAIIGSRGRKVRARNNAELIAWEDEEAERVASGSTAYAPIF